jgi:hypothetical protein
MSHSTHVGFNCPPAGTTPCAGSVSCRRRCPAEDEPFQSVALGEGTRRGVWLFPKRTASVKLTPGCAREPGRFREPAAFASPAVGVGQRAPAVARSSPPLPWRSARAAKSGPLGLAFGVGHSACRAMAPKLGRPRER